VFFVIVSAGNLLLGEFIGNWPIVSHRARPHRFDLVVEYHGWLSDSRSFEELTFRFILAWIAPLFDVSVLGRCYGTSFLQRYLLYKRHLYRLLLDLEVSRRHVSTDNVWYSVCFVELSRLIKSLDTPGTPESGGFLRFSEAESTTFDGASHSTSHGSLLQLESRAFIHRV